MEGVVFWLVMAASTNPFLPGHIGPMTQERCVKAAEALGGAECKRQVGVTTCSWKGGGTAYVCPIFEGEMVQVGPR